MLNRARFSLTAVAAAVTAVVALVPSGYLYLTRSQARYGQVSTLAILTAEQAYQSAEPALVQAQANRFADTAGLFVALGGGWWNRGETGPS